MPDGGDQGDTRGGGGADDDFLVEAPEILDRASATGDDEHVGAGNRAAGGKGVEARDGAGDLGRAGGALDGHGPDEHAAGKPVAQAVEDVADHGAGGRSDDAYDAGEVGERFLAGGVEEALGSEGCLAFLEHRHERADAGGGDVLDDHLVLGLARKGCQPARRDDFHPFLGALGEAGGLAFPADCGEDGAVVLEVEIDVAGGRAGDAANLAPDADEAEFALDHALDGAREVGDGKLGQVALGGGVFEKVHDA